MHRTPHARPADFQTTKPCREFAAGRCSYGARCKFSHDTHGTNPVPPRPAPQNRSSNWRKDGDEPDQDKLRQWKRLLRHNPSQRDAGERFFQLALQLMDGDVGASQETIKRLAEELGLVYIKELVLRHIAQAFNAAAKAHLWKHNVRPLFQLLTHSRVVNSAVLEQEVAVIYNFIRGVDSSRMRVLFDFILGLLESWSILPNTNVDDSELSVASLSLAVLAKMVDANTTNIVDSNFKDVVERFGVFLETFDAASDDLSRLQAQKYMRYLRLRLGVGDSISMAGTSTRAPVTRAEFVLRKDLPGRLSTNGPRHDNDHADIANISVLPTHGEIVSTRAEYLPTNDPTQFHLPGIRGRLDREFRLLREDTVGQLRDSVRAQLEALRNPAGRAQGQRAKNALRTFVYDSARVTDMVMGQHGLDLLVEFRQPAQMKELRRRQEWWEHSKRLQAGGLVCVVSGGDGAGSVLFFVVADTTTIIVDPKGKNQAVAGTEESRRSSLAEDESFACVHLHLADTGPRNIAQTLAWYRGNKWRHQRCLVEFPGVLLPSFQHTLTALQRMSQKPNIPFVDLIAPSDMESNIDIEVPPPQYALQPGFVFNLSCLTNDDTALSTSPRQPLRPDELASHSTLDVTQSKALLDTLNQCLALTQGPPGTGKSYTGEKVIKVLLANKAKAKLGPILCVCYTNHALDQLLVHLLDDGVQQIIRIGSRSKSERLEELNLRFVSKGADRTKNEKESMWNYRHAVNSRAGSITECLEDLASSESPKVMQEYLNEEYPMHHDALFNNIDEEGFQTVRHHSNQTLEQWRQSGSQNPFPNRKVEELRSTVNPWEMTHDERVRIYNYWLKSLHESRVDDIVNNYTEYQASKDGLDRVFRDVDLRCLHNADIIGVTTTGLARNLDLLQKARCKVMLCEEAGEVLEAHTLTALLPSVEHAILIGDHLQLRPQIQNYDLNSTNRRGAQYSLDVSLFERLVKPPHESDPRLPFNTLETQRRMHPSISNLIRSILYPSLEDGGQVSQYPEVLGMKKRLFWLQHERPEDGAAQIDHTTTSHTNSFEIEMTIALVQHLVRQGSYGPDDIAVITPYLGQLFHLRHKMQDLFEISVGERDLEELDSLEADSDPTASEPNWSSSSSARKSPVRKTTLLKSIRLATVDNFQGEEAKIVVISLVRSNAQNRCGFLSTPNRINVLLSRAQHAMYLIGNDKTYGHVPMWAKVCDMLQEHGNIGEQLELQCPRHPEKPMFVSSPDHFLQFSPEGGCMQLCDRRLECGHSCVSRCHSNVIHSAVKCLEPCSRPQKGCHHPCRLVCGDQCLPKCTERLTGVELSLPCGHIASSPLCWESQSPALIRCKQKVKRTVPGCGHKVTEPCHVDVTGPVYKCQATCEKIQSPCGHRCRSSCHKCNDRENGVIVNENHGICTQPCDRNYTTCQHRFTTPCHGDVKCPPCSQPCEVRCSHSQCSKKCHEPCAPCAEQKCASQCEHVQCNMPCAAPCDWVPCSKRCEKLLICGHRCPSICGEACPPVQYCQTCCSEKVGSTPVDFIMGTVYRDVDLDDDPCIFPDCGHFLTKSNMDGVMDMQSHYGISAEGNPISISSASVPFSMDEIKTCPSCRGSLRSIARYGRIVRRAMLDETTKKFIFWSNEETLKLANSLLDVQKALSEAPHPRALPRDMRPAKTLLSSGRLKQFHLIRDWEGGERYQRALNLWNRISKFIGQVRKEEQPLQRVADFVQHTARNRKQQEGQPQFIFDEANIQYKAQLHAQALLLKCELLVMMDFMELRKKLSGTRPEISLDFTSHMKECKALVHLAEETKRPREQVEGHVYFAQFCALARSFVPDDESQPESTTPSEAKRQSLKSQAEMHLANARTVVDQFPSVVALAREIEAAETMLHDSVFYNELSAEEMRAVYQAMSAGFMGTGHWYTCENGHPFTVGECGMPMEEAKCPECGATVGGTHHRPADGVRRADDIEELHRDLDNLRV